MSLIKLAQSCKDEIEQLRVQLAGVGVAAMGGTKPSMVAKKEDWGWSPAYQDVLNLRRKYDKLLEKKALETSPIVEDPKDPRLLPMTERQKPQIRVKPNKTVLNWGMKK